MWSELTALLCLTEVDVALVLNVKSPEPILTIVTAPVTKPPALTVLRSVVFAPEYVSAEPTVARVNVSKPVCVNSFVPTADNTKVSVPAPPVSFALALPSAAS